MSEANHIKSGTLGAFQRVKRSVQQLMDEPSAEMDASEGSLFTGGRLEALGKEALVTLEVFASRFAFALVVLCLGWLLVSWIFMPVLNWIMVSRSRFKPTVAHFVVTSCGAVLKFLLVFTAVDILGIEVLSLGVLLAAFGVGLGGSLSNMIQNFFSGLLLVVQEPFRWRDYLVLGGGVEGEVLEIGLTHTKLESPSLTIFYVANSKLLETNVENLTALKVVRLNHLITVRHTEDTRVLREMFLELCASDPFVLAFPKPLFFVRTVSTDGLVIQCSPYVAIEHFWDNWFHFKESIVRHYRRYGVHFQVSRMEVEMTPAGVDFNRVERQIRRKELAKGEEHTVQQRPPSPMDRPMDRPKAPSPAIEQEEEEEVEGGVPSRPSSRLGKHVVSESDVDDASFDKVPSRHVFFADEVVESVEGEYSTETEDDDDDHDHILHKASGRDYRTVFVSKRDRERLHLLNRLWDDMLVDVEQARNDAPRPAALKLRKARRSLRRLRRKLGGGGGGRSTNATSSGMSETLGASEKVAKQRNLTKINLKAHFERDEESRARERRRVPNAFGRSTRENGEPKRRSRRRVRRLRVDQDLEAGQPDYDASDDDQTLFAHDDAIHLPVRRRDWRRTTIDDARLFRPHIGGLPAAENLSDEEILHEIVAAGDDGSNVDFQSMDDASDTPVLQFKGEEGIHEEELLPRRGLRNRLLQNLLVHTADSRDVSSDSDSNNFD